MKKYNRYARKSDDLINFAYTLMQFKVMTNNQYCDILDKWLEEPYLEDLSVV